MSTSIRSAPLSRLSRLARLPLPELALVAVTLAWGGTFLVTQVALRDSGPFGLLTVRFGLAALTLGVVFARRLRSITGAELRAGGVVGLVIFALYVLQTMGLQHIASSESAFITALYVPIVPLLQLLLLRQPPRAAAWAGIAVSFAGLALLSSGGGLRLTLGIGEWLTLGCAVMAAFHIILVSRFAAGADPMRFAFVQLSVVAVLSAVALPLSGEALPAPTPSFLLSALGLGLIATAFTMSAMNWAQRTISATRATLIFALEPVWGGAVGALAGEPMTPPIVGGSALILLGVLVSELRPRRPEAAVPADHPDAELAPLRVAS